MSCEDIPSLLDLQNTKKHVDDFGRLMGIGEGDSTNEVTGQTRPTYNKVMKSVGFKPGSGDFTTGFTVMPGERDIAWYDPVSKNWYSWLGVIPTSGHPVVPGTNPVGSVDWSPRTDQLLREELASTGGSAIVRTSIGSTVEAELALARTNRNQDDTVKASRVLDVNGLDVEDDYQQITKHRLSLAPLTSTGSVIFLGDSIGNGQGASTYKASYLYRFMRSLLNSRSGYGAADQGYGYETYLNMATAVISGGISHNGTLLTGSGAADSRLRLLAGQSLTVTGRQMQALDIFYDSSVSSGNIDFSLNGVVYATKSVGSGLTTFPTSLYAAGSSIHPDDIVTITAAGTVVITGIITLREASGAPYVTSVCRSGWGFDEFAVQARVDEVVSQVNTFKNGGPHTLFVMLGTNNIYNAGLHKTPSDYITALGTLIGKYVTGLGGPTNTINVVIQVPLQANETTFPLIPGYTYGDYVKAIVEYGSANGYIVVRFDRIGASNAYYDDGVHPNNAGHAAMTAKMCSTMGLPFNYGEFHQTPTLDHYREADITYNAKYKTYADLASLQVKAHKQGRILIMSGMAAPNGATGADLIVGTLPKGMRPVNGDIYTVASTNSGPVSIVIKRDGTINLSAVPSIWISFTGVSFVLRSQS